MARIRQEVHDGEQGWVPWMGLALVVPAVLVLLVGIFGLASGANWTASGYVSPGGGSQAVSVVGGGIAAVCACIALMLGLIGLVRGLRRQTPHNGRSVGLAGLTFEIALVAVAAIAMVVVGIWIF